MNNFREIDLRAWKQVGEGGNGTTYTCQTESGVILKVARHTKTDGSFVAVSHEFYTSKAFYEAGVTTPKMIELVRVGEDYGIISEFITNKKSLARLSGEQPELIDDLAYRMAVFAKQLHGTKVECNPGQDISEHIPSMKHLMLEALANTRMLRGRTLSKTIEFVQGLEDAPTLLHGDFTFSNIIVEVPFAKEKTEKTYWIDLGRGAHGVPMFDLGHFYLFCNIFGRQKRVQGITHMTGKQMQQFWNSFALAYNGPEGLDEFTAQCKHFAVLDVILLGHIQTLNWHERLFLGLLAKLMVK